MSCGSGWWSGSGGNSNGCRQSGGLRAIVRNHHDNLVPDFGPARDDAASSGCRLLLDRRAWNRCPPASFRPAAPFGTSEQLFHKVGGRCPGHDDHRADGDALQCHRPTFVGNALRHHLGLGGQDRDNHRSAAAPTAGSLPIRRVVPAPARCPSPAGSAGESPGTAIRPRCGCSWRNRA